MLDQFRRLRRDEFDLDDQRYADLVETVTRWRAEAQNITTRPEH
jgi:hypothetical protein